MGESQAKSLKSREFRQILILLRARKRTGGEKEKGGFLQAHKRRRWQHRFIPLEYSPGGRARVNRSLDLVEA